jgi:hypothetical protein
MKKFSCAVAIFFLFVCSSAQAKMIAVAANQATLHNWPNPAATTVLEAPLNYPLDVIDEDGGYYKVVDFRHRDGWIEKQLTDSSRSAVVKVKSANVRKGPNTSEEIVFKANQGVAFKVADEKEDWFKVVHESGKSGWIHKSLLWGL